MAVSKLWGDFGEWPARFTTLLCLGGYAASVYFFSKKHLDRLSAFTLAMMLLTGGRILIWDSMLGLIDIAFSWVIFLNFMVLYHMGAKGRWQAMFILSYLLGSAAFLLKGLPAVVFQGISVLAALWQHGVLRSKIFSKAHFSGIGMGVLPVLLYYGLYMQSVSLERVFEILLDQSMQRTATHHGLAKTLEHLFSFPLEQVYHFLPWSLLMVVVFLKKFRTWVNSDAFVRFNFWMLLANLPVYWLSVEVYPRYLLMFVPLFNLVCFYVLQKISADNKTWWRGLQILFAVVASIAALGFWGIPLVGRARELSYWIPAWLGSATLLSFAALGLWSDSRRAFLWLAVAMLSIRIGFDCFVLPFRTIDDKTHFTRDDAYRLGTRWGDRNWYVYGETETHMVARFYTTDALQKIIPKSPELRDKAGLYFVDLQLYPDFPGTKVDSIRLENGQVLPLLQLNQ
ncbi:MAG: hypothetical protein IPL65_04870 [Lewinellaceae bacterium]|nr:hypothetical protein [Lewinellaceae bacterium]